MAGKEILPLDLGSTGAHQLKLYEVVEEIVRIDEEAPLTLRGYTRRNPLVMRSDTGIFST